MDLIEQVKEDSQMLFDKRDVLKLLEKQKAEDVEKACEWLWQQVIDADLIEGSKNVELLLNSFKKAMKGE